MNRKTLIALLGTFLSCSALAGASQGDFNPIFLHRDSGLEQYLHDDAQVDKTLTPGRAFRWMMSAFGHPIHSAPSAVEFRPIVNAHDNRTSVVATFAYKF